MAQTLVTQTAFAARMGVNKSQVTRWIEKGMPHTPKGVDPVAAEAWVHRSVDPTKRRLRNSGQNRTADDAALERVDAMEQFGRIALRLAIHGVPDIARKAALDAGLTEEQAEAVHAAALARAPELEEPIKNMMLIQENDAEPLGRVTHPLEVGRDRDGALTLLQERTRVARGQADALEMENDLRRRQIVEVQDVARLVGQDYARLRVHVLAIPAQHAPQLARIKTPAAMQEALYAILVKALEELTQDKAYDA